MSVPLCMTIAHCGNRANFVKALALKDVYKIEKLVACSCFRKSQAIPANIVFQDNENCFTSYPPVVIVLFESFLPTFGRNSTCRVCDFVNCDIVYPREQNSVHRFLSKEILNQEILHDNSIFIHQQGLVCFDYYL